MVMSAGCLDNHGSQDLHHSYSKGISKATVVSSVVTVMCSELTCEPTMTSVPAVVNSVPKQ